jgi:hypothetical protein
VIRDRHAFRSFFGSRFPAQGDKSTLFPRKLLSREFDNTDCSVIILGSVNITITKNDYSLIYALLRYCLHCKFIVVTRDRRPICILFCSSVVTLDHIQWMEPRYILRVQHERRVAIEQPCSPYYACA